MAWSAISHLSMNILFVKVKLAWSIDFKWTMYFSILIFLSFILGKFALSINATVITDVGVCDACLRSLGEAVRSLRYLITPAAH